MGKINYFYGEELYTKYNSNNPNTAKFRTLYGYDEPINRKDADSLYKFDYVYSEEIILDIDNGSNIEKAFEDTDKTVKYLSDKYNAKVNVYWSGLNGTHIVIPLKEPLKLSLYDNGLKKDGTAKAKTIIAYDLLRQELNNALDIEYDKTLNQGTRLIQLPNIKKNNEKGRTYKISIGNCRDLNKIRSYGKKNKNIVDPQKYDNLEFIEHLKELDKSTYVPTLDNSKTSKKKTKSNKSKIQANKIDESLESVKISDEDLKIIVDVYNALLKENQNQGRHDIGLWIASGLNGYFTLNQVKQVIDKLSDETDIADSTNYYNSFIDAFENDKEPENIGSVYNHLIVNEKALFNKFEKVLSKYQEINHQVKTKSDYELYNKKLESNNNEWFDVLDNEMFDYVDNTENIFKGIINGLSALLGFGSRFIVVNGGAEVGKSEFINTIKKLMPNFENLGSSTPAAIRRQQEDSFNRKIVYLGDKGLKGKDDEEFKGLQEVFGGLITEKEFVRDIVVGDKVMHFELISDGVCVFYTEPYTNLRLFGAGDQYTTRSTFITVNPVKDGLALFLQDEDKENPFYEMHKNYIEYIINNPVDTSINNDIKTKLYYASNESTRTAKYLLSLFKAYCQYLRLSEPTIEDAEKFLKTFKPQLNVTEIEYMVYEKLYNNLSAISDDDLEYKINEDGSILSDDMLLQTKDRKEKSFFTAKQIKTYFKTDFKMNKNLKDTIDQIPEILKNLYDASLIDKIDWQYNNQNVYYIPINEDLEQ